MPTLYSDQKRDVVALREHLSKHGAVIYCLPTGGGKSVVAGAMAQLLRLRNRKVLILVHRRELVQQFFDTLVANGLHDNTGVVCRGWPTAPQAPIQVAMIMSWASRKERLMTPEFIFVDEAHHARAATYERVLSSYPDAWVLGLTATPRRLDGKGLGQHFNHLYMGSNVPELIEAKRLAPVRTLFVPAGFLRKGLHRSNREFLKSELDERANAKVVGASVNAYQKYIPDRQAIMFAVSRRHAHETADKFNEVGIAAAYVGGDTPDRERETVLRRFAEGHTKVICNVALIDEGFDVPACDAVMDVAPTCSVTRFLQRVGRCMRYQPGKEAIFLDLVGNVHTHGMPDAVREWSLDFGDGDPKHKTETNSGMRHCRKCMTVFAIRLTECPSCGTPHTGRPITEVDVELLEGDLNAVPPPKPVPAKAKKAPRMTRTRLTDIYKQARNEMRQGHPEVAWQLLVATARDAGYHKNWCVHIANLIGIPESHRYDDAA